jgi:hypothetical protein
MVIAPGQLAAFDLRRQELYVEAARERLLDYVRSSALHATVRAKTPTLRLSIFRHLGGSRPPLARPGLLGSR